MDKTGIFKKNHSEKILSVKISTLTKREILKLIALRAKNNKQTIIFTPNPQILLKAQSSKELTLLLNSSFINVPDGIGIVIASKLLKGKIRSRISGIDLAESILLLAQKQSYNVFLLGAEPTIAKKASIRLKKRFPALKICGTHHGYFNKSGKENQKIIRAIQKAKPDIIFVCMGCPAQEKWIIDNASSLPSVKIFIGLGGSLDVWAGKVDRAPSLFKITGFEWLWRVIQDPKKAKIFLDIPIFTLKIIKEKIKGAASFSAEQKHTK